jgi:hypothetical protein
VIGTNTPGYSLAGNQLYVLRDRDALSPSPSGLDRPAITDADLPLREPGLAIPLDVDAAGYRIPLGSGRSLSRSVTAGGTLLYVTVQTAPPADECGTAEASLVNVRVGAIRIEDAGPALDLDGDGQRRREDAWVALADAVPPDSRVVVETFIDEDGRPGTRCRVGTQALADCIAPPRLQFTDWRREDAD